MVNIKTFFCLIGLFFVTPAFAASGQQISCVVYNSTNNPVAVGPYDATNNAVRVNTVANSTVGVSTVTFNGTSQPVNFTATGVNASTSSIVPLRPSQGNNRTYKTGNGDNLSASTTIYTVTAGKTLYVTSMNISGFNTSTTNSGRIRVQDGANTIIPISIPTAGIGATAASTMLSLAGDFFLEPKQFTNALNLTVVSGTLTFSFDFTGYEE